MIATSADIQFLQALVHRPALKELTQQGEARYGASVEEFALEVDFDDEDDVRRLEVRSSNGDVCLEMDDTALLARPCETILERLRGVRREKRPASAGVRAFTPVQVTLLGAPRISAAPPQARKPQAAAPLWHRAVLSRPGYS